jgi:hypothetical protein
VKVLEWPEARDQHFSRSFYSFFIFLDTISSISFQEKTRLALPTCVKEELSWDEKNTHTHCVCLSLYRQFFSRIKKIICKKKNQRKCQTSRALDSFFLLSVDMAEFSRVAPGHRYRRQIYI